MLNKGYKLTPAIQDIASQVAVANPARIHILEVDIFPKPENPKLKELAAHLGLLTEHTAGLTLGHAILIKRGLFSNRLLSHECRHVYQYEQAGSINHFLTSYLTSLLKHGYVDCPYEQDARQHEITHLT